jgi:hypothetical protein
VTAPHGLHDGAILLGLARGADEASHLRRRFELRAGNAVEIQDVAGGGLREAETLEPPQ